MERPKTVDDMIRMLTELSNDGFGECRIVAAYQPNYPLRGSFDGIVPPEDYENPEGPCPECGKEYTVEGPEGCNCSTPDTIEHEHNVVHILVGTAPWDMNPYAPMSLWKER